ncbi:MAG: ribosome small subunit-dependent GTPase A [Tyzzerella sp.]|uniref:Small ribosomal subunit biogenesis GTPase RsgA n=1 Tax=Candidatus Fimicola merdigallinarum TaxID=2840819 RepID=A0A9D9E111_9FIRM|nr:ribosome small subunit-dependent GTPase A [Candidatus Fimicola merdigallinarum]
MINGTIIKGIGGFYYIDTENGVYECRARGIFRKEKLKPTVGDQVKISVLDEKNKKGSLDVIEPRKNMLIRPRVSNVEQAVIVFASVSPDINIDLLDRFLILVSEQKLDVLICINKIDLDEEKKYEYVKKLYEDSGYRVILLSAEKGVGIDEIKSALKDKISVFAGPSGVGKSSLINAISPDLQLKTGEISAKIERGKHTTRHAELMQIEENSYIVDSPGFTSLFLEHIPAEELQYHFKEFEPYINQCRYTGCSHIHEPDCAIKEQVGVNIRAERYERYVNLYNELRKGVKR